MAFVDCRLGPQALVEVLTAAMPLVKATRFGSPLGGHQALLGLGPSSDRQMHVQQEKSSVALVLQELLARLIALWFPVLAQQLVEVLLEQDQEGRVSGQA